MTPTLKWEHILYDPKFANLCDSSLINDNSKHRLIDNPWNPVAKRTTIYNTQFYLIVFLLKKNMTGTKFHSFENKTLRCTYDEKWRFCPFRCIWPTLMSKSKYRNWTSSSSWIFQSTLDLNSSTFQFIQFSSFSPARGIFSICKIRTTFINANFNGFFTWFEIMF